MESCKTCKYGVENEDALDGIACNGNNGRGCADECLNFYNDKNPMFNRWQPKEKSAVEENLYTTGQMIDLLLENPKRKAKCQTIIYFYILVMELDTKLQITIFL